MSDWMRQALTEAARVTEQVYPYPGVGVVIVEDGKVVALARNDKPGEGRHAEIKALDEAKTRQADLSRCILYTNLEPCCNVGLTHSCAEAIIEVKIPEVHVALLDPYHLVRGKGIERLQEAGVKVVMGEYADETRWMLRKYLERFCPSCGWALKD